MLGRKMAPWMMRPMITVTIYMPSCLATTSRSLMEMILPQMRQAIPKGEYLFRCKGFSHFFKFGSPGHNLCLL